MKRSPLDVVLYHRARDENRRPPGPRRERWGASKSVDDGDSTTGLARVLAPVRALLGRASETVCRALGSTGDDCGEHSRLVSPDDTAARSVDRSIALADREGGADRPAVSKRRERQPVPAESPEPHRPPELVARWHDDRLTLSEPDREGARISSDTWSEVDP